MRRRKGSGKEIKPCEICGKLFESLICNKRRFCSWPCGYKGRHVHKTQKEYNCKVCNKKVLRSDCQVMNNVFCSIECSAIDQRISHKGKGRARDPSKRTILSCKQCGIMFERFTCSVPPGRDRFCSQSCSAKYTNKHKRGNRSKLEKWLGVKLKERELPVLLNNREILNGYELDIYFPTKNVAFEIDGPWHRIPLNSEEHFQSIKKNDALKESRCVALGIELIRIPNEEQFSEQIGNTVLAIILSKLA